MNSSALQLVEFDITPTVTASSAYSSGQQVGGLQTLNYPAIAQGRFAMLATLTILDIDNQKAALTVLLFNSSPTIASIDKGTFSITAAALKATCIGQFPIVAGDYATAGSIAVATKTYSNAFLNSIDNAGQLFAAVVTTGTPTYTTTTSLMFRWVFAKNF